MGQNNMSNLAIKEQDYVTVYTGLTVINGQLTVTAAPDQEILKSRFEADRHILEQARQKVNADDAELDFDLEALKQFQFAIRSNEDANLQKSVCFIFQSAMIKLITEVQAPETLIIEAFQKGRPRRISKGTEDAIRGYLAEKSLLFSKAEPEAEIQAEEVQVEPEQDQLIIWPENSVDMTDENEVTAKRAEDSEESAAEQNGYDIEVVNSESSEQQSGNLFDDASSVALMTQATSDLQSWDSIVTAAQDLELANACGIEEANANSATTMIFAEDEANAIESFEPVLDEASAYVDADEIVVTKSEPEVPELSEREIGLKINAIISKLNTAYCASDIRQGLNELSTYEQKIPGIMMGLNVPSFETACMASYKKIITNKHGFIDDLDSSLMELGIEGGLTEEQAKLEMSDRALALFNNGLSSLSGNPLKKSRAEKIMTFASMTGKMPLIKAQHYAQAKHIVHEIFVHETQRTPKPQRDREMCKIFTDLNIWFGNELS